MARKMPTAAEYRNAQRVTGMKDVDIADVRDITRRGLKAPVPARKRGKVKTKTKPRLVTVNKPKPALKPQPTAAQKVAKISAAKPNNGVTAEELDVIGRAGKNAPVSTKPLAVAQKVKVDEHGGMSANDAPKISTDYAKDIAKRAAGDDWANRRHQVYDPRKDPDILALKKKRNSSEYLKPKAPIDRTSGKLAAIAVPAGVGAAYGAWRKYSTYTTGSGVPAKDVLANPKRKGTWGLVRFGRRNAAIAGAKAGAAIGAGAGATGIAMNEVDEREKRRRK